MGRISKMNLKGPIYVMYNPKNEIKIECTEKYAESWKRRGFAVLKIKKIK
jgi:hypothetical protein